MTSTSALVPHEKEDASDYPVLHLSNGQVKLFGEFKLQNNCNQSCSSKNFGAGVNDLG